MGKQETIGFILIGIVLIVWMWMSAPPPRQETNGQPSASPTEQPAETITPPQPITQAASGEQSADNFGKYFTHLADGPEKVLIIETDLYTAEVTTHGGRLRKWGLTNYETWDGYPVQMVDPETGGDFGLVFISTDGKEIRTSGLMFEAGYRPWQKVRLKELESHTVTFVLPVSESQRIIKRLTFRNGSYSCDSEIELQNMQNVVANFEYHVTWENGVRYAEQNSIDESSYAHAYAYQAGELAELDAGSIGEPARADVNGVTDWVATRNKYFAVAMIPGAGSCQGALLEGRRRAEADKGESEHYGLSLKMPFRGTASEGATVTLYLGPLDIDLLKAFDNGLEEIMSLGWWIIRWIAEILMIPLFSLLHFFIPNYGVVIIAFSVIIKVLLHPLSKKSMQSMKKMQALQPMMNEIKEKYKDDHEKMNKAVMNLYKEYGVNPASGCLPLLLQMPILFALYSVFRSTIELRQAGFMLWITDLSVPDVMFELPFSLPLFGITAVSGLAVAMGLTMFIQQKMTVTDPRQKAMVYMMPIMMTLIFNGLPSGLNLYYFVFNLLSIGQQMWMNKTTPDTPLQKVDAKKRSTGIMARLTKDLPKVRR